LQLGFGVNETTTKTKTTAPTEMAALTRLLLDLEVTTSHLPMLPEIMPEAQDRKLCLEMLPMIIV
jgi:hypothetical protein